MCQIHHHAFSILHASRNHCQDEQDALFRSSSHINSCLRDLDSLPRRGRSTVSITSFLIFLHHPAVESRTCISPKLIRPNWNYFQAPPPTSNNNCRKTPRYARSENFFSSYIHFIIHHICKAAIQRSVSHRVRMGIIRRFWRLRRFSSCTCTKRMDGGSTGTEHQRAIEFSVQHRLLHRPAEHRDMTCMPGSQSRGFLCFFLQFPDGPIVPRTHMQSTHIYSTSLLHMLETFVIGQCKLSPTFSTQNVLFHAMYSFYIPGKV